MPAAIFAIALAGAAAIAPIMLPESTATLDMTGTPIEARYEGTIEIVMEQRGHVVHGRQTGEHCAWKSNVQVRRNVVRADATPVPALSRTLDAHRLAKGSKPGTCAMWKKALEAEVAGKRDAATQQMAKLVAADRARISSELAALGTNKTGSMD